MSVALPLARSIAGHPFAPPASETAYDADDESQPLVTRRDDFLDKSARAGSSAGTIPHVALSIAQPKHAGALALRIGAMGRPGAPRAGIPAGEQAGCGFLWFVLLTVTSVFLTLGGAARVSGEAGAFNRGATAPEPAYGWTMIAFAIFAEGLGVTALCLAGRRACER